MTRLMKLIPNMIEIMLNNVTFMGYRDKVEGDYRPQDVKSEIL